jgi:hypothetical protein
MSTQVFVRLKPYAPSRGHVIRRYSHGGIRFDEERGWYKVDEALALELRQVHQIQEDPYSPLAFDVCSEEEARGLNKVERLEEEKRRHPEDAMPPTQDLTAIAPKSTLTTADLNKAAEKPVPAPKKSKR